MDLSLAAQIGLTAIGLATAVGNGTVFLVYFSARSLRTLTNQFVLSLAVSDFFVGTVLLPLKTWSPRSEVLGPLIAFMLTASLSNISGCTYDRYVAIHNPLRYHSILTTTKVRRVIILIWAIPLIIAVTPQIWLHQNLGAKAQLIQRIYVGLLSSAVLVTCVVLAGIYVSVFQVAKCHVQAISCLGSFAQNATNRGVKRRNSLKSLIKDVKATKLAAMIGAVFVLCWFPLIFINIMDSLGFARIIPLDFANTALFTIFANSLLNPIIYAFFQKDFRVTLRKLVRKTFKQPDKEQLLNIRARNEKSTIKDTKAKALDVCSGGLLTVDAKPDKPCKVDFIGDVKETECL